MTEIKVAKLLKFIIVEEHLLEQERTRIANLDYFNPSFAFRCLDFNNDGLLSENEFQSFLKASAIPFNTSDLNYLLGLRSDKLEPGLNIRSFMKMVLPWSNPELEEFARKRRKPASEAYRRKVCLELKNFFRLLLKCFHTIEHEKIRVGLGHSTNLFILLNAKLQDWVTFEEMQIFMRRQHLAFSFKDWKAVVSRSG